MRRLIAFLLLFGALPASAQDSVETVSTLLQNGGAVLNVVTTQEWPVMFILSTDKRLFICTLDYDTGNRVFDYRQPAPAMTDSRCSEIR